MAVGCAVQCGAEHLGSVGGVRSVGAQAGQLREVSLSQLAVLLSTLV